MVSSNLSILPFNLLWKLWDDRARTNVLNTPDDLNGFVITPWAFESSNSRSVVGLS